MSGHSKWSTIKRQKEATDKKRGAIFTKLGRAIAVAVREGRGDPHPETNFKLRLAVEKARAANMPKGNIKRAIDRATAVSGGGEAFSEVAYEGYGPAGIGIIIETTTDNKQRTGQEIRNLLDRLGGSLASPGSVSYNFIPTGLIQVSPPADREKAALDIIDLGAQDVDITPHSIQVYTSPRELSSFRTKLEKAGHKIISIQLIQKPKTLLPLPADQEAKLSHLLEALEDHPDVQQIFTNAKSAPN